MKKTKLRKTSKLTIAKLKKKLDVAFSIAMRKHYYQIQQVNIDFIRCYTCSAIIHISKAQVSHFISRTHHSTRWDEDNVRLCCPRCNIWLNGNLAEFAIRLINEKGQAFVEALMQKSREIKQWRPAELEAEIKKLSTE